MSEETPVPQTPRAGCVLFALPILLTVVIASMYLLLFGLGSITGAASGERVTWSVNTCPAAKEIIAARVNAIGLGEPVWTGQGGAWTLTATLPGRDPEVDKRVPAVLSQTGKLGVFAGSESNISAQIIDHEDIVSSSFTLREMANPLIEVRLTKDALKTLREHMGRHQDGRISIWLDHEKILDRENTPIIEGNLLELRDHDEDGKKVLRHTAEWSIILGDGPLPCDASINP